MNKPFNPKAYRRKHPELCFKDEEIPKHFKQPDKPSKPKKK